MKIKLALQQALNKIRRINKPTVEPQPTIQPTLGYPDISIQPIGQQSVSTPVTTYTGSYAVHSIPTSSIYSSIIGTGGGMSTSTSSVNISPVMASNTPWHGNITTASICRDPIVLHGSNGFEVVRLTNNGSVVWAQGIDVDEAAKAFATSMCIGAELMTGITYSVKQRMRDAVFEELIDMANTKGILSVDDLTYLHQSAKIMDKLKGIKE